MTQVDQILNCRWLLPIAPENTILEHHSIAINAGKIIAVAATATIKQEYKSNNNIDLLDHVVTPGFVNSHTHASMNLFRGIADDVDFVDWLTNNILPAEQIVCNEEAIIAGSKLSIAEMLRTGTTCFNDNYFFPHVTAEIAKQLGIRASVGLQIYNVENQWSKTADEAIDKGLAVFNAAEKHELISWMLAPHAPYTVTDDNFSRIKEISDQHELRVHLHLCESQAETQHSLDNYNKRPIARLDDLELLNDKLLAVHMLDVNPEEITLLAKKGVHIAHCPESNQKLANGFAPIKAYGDAGINITIGTDGAASNNDLDMLGEARTASFTAKALSKDPKTLSALTCLKMITLNGAKALGLDDKIGSIEIGKAADITAVDLSDNITQPVFNPASHLIYCAAKTQVSDVWVAGKRLLQNFKLTAIDQAELKAIANEWQPKILAAIGKGDSVRAI